MAGMLPEDVYELTGVADPRLSPDGQTVAVTIWRIDRDANEYRSAIWLVPVNGSEPARQFTSGERGDSDPRWSPDGTQLAFLSNRGGEEEKKQLYVMPAGGGEPRKLTSLKEDATEPVWSPDGERIAFTSRVPDPAYEEEDERKRAPRRFTRLQYKLDNVGWTGDRRQQLFVVRADGSSEPTQLTSGDYEAMAPGWSPDSARIAFASARDDDWDTKIVQDIYVVGAGGGDPERLTEGETLYEAPSWSPDGSLIACRWAVGGFDWPRHGQIAVVDAKSGTRRVLTESLDRNCAPFPEIREPVWDGDRILFVIEDQGNWHVYGVRPDGSSEPELVVGGELAVTGFDARGGNVVHTATTVTMLPELYAGDRRLTEATHLFADARDIVDAERFTAVSEDGSEVEAWIVRPPDFDPSRRYPVLLNVHGGPFTQYGNRFFDEFQVYATAGYVVLYSNPRGSSGYSEEWGRAIRGPSGVGPGWGPRDYEDVMAVADEALRRFDFCDSERLGILGGSYGGFMTSWVVGHTDRFRAACSERSVNNFISEYGSSDIGWAFKGYVGTFPFEDLEPYIQISPSTYATEITTPLLIMHSENDLRCAIEQAEHLFTTLRLLKREVELVRFPAESHELSRSGSPLHRVQRFEIMLEWFERHLDPGKKEPLADRSAAAVGVGAQARRRAT
jgi:dipeptidyl aminopeptidase/acylaminoacyl peptidase